MDSTASTSADHQQTTKSDRMLRPRRDNGNNDAKKTSILDERGRYRETGVDACDCLDNGCPGCHFPCPACGSGKCGTKCRINRNWVVRSIVYPGSLEPLAKNPNLEWPETKKDVDLLDADKGKDLLTKNPNLKRPETNEVVDLLDNDEGMSLLTMNLNLKWPETIEVVDLLSSDEE